VVAQLSARIQCAPDLPGGPLARDAAGKFRQQLYHQVGKAADQGHEQENQNPETTAASLKHMDDQGQLKHPNND
jgi:hypothetical protein